MRHVDLMEKVYEKTNMVRDLLEKIDEAGYQHGNKDEAEQNIFLNVLNSVVEMFEDNLEESQLLEEE